MLYRETMFSNFYDYVSLLFYWLWPKAEGVVTTLDVRREQETRLVVRYKFSVGSDGPYTGESSWPLLAGGGQVMNLGDALREGQPVTVRYRKDDPSVNKLDRTVWRAFEGL